MTPDDALEARKEEWVAFLGNAIEGAMRPMLKAGPVTIRLDIFKVK
jgi:hypothetical protein